MLAILALIGRLKPLHIVQLGDLYDFYSFSRFPRTHNLMTPLQEVEQGRKEAEAFWRDIRKAAGPKAECYQLIGNHDARPAKRVLEKAPELGHLVERGLSGLWDFKDVTTMPSDREELVLSGIVFHHGWRKHGDHVKHNHQSTVVGHLHTGGTVFVAIKGETLFELNAGYIANPLAVPMSYGAQKRFRKETQGVGWIDDLGPRFIPL